MMRITPKKFIGLGLLMLALGITLVSLGTPGLQAQGPAPPTATPNIPPPANPENGNNTRDNKDNRSDKGHSPTVGAVIELHALNLPAGAWSVVQWQDANGDWQKVEGWQGSLENDTRRWWVHPKDFGTGPFRWTIYASPGGGLIAASEPFILPHFPTETVQLEAVPVKRVVKAGLNRLTEK